MSSIPADLTRVRLVVTCPDKVGIVAAVARCLADHGANIEQSQQYTSAPLDGTFFLRLELVASVLALTELRMTFKALADRYSMVWQMREVGDRKRLVVLASRDDHCVGELLWLWRRDALDGEIVLVASDHPDLERIVTAAGARFCHIPYDDEADGEARLLPLVEGQCDVLVLAGFNPPLSYAFRERIGVPIIGIHSSLLPAFDFDDPYALAHERGVKIIGATAHYVRNDDAPIIEQDVIRVSHQHDAAAFAELGARVERTVLARAVQWHCEDRVFLRGSTTVILQ